MAKRTLNFGPLTIDFEVDGRTPFGVPIEASELEKEIIFVTLSPITFTREGVAGGITVPRDFEFDGASIPRELWLVPGFAPCGKHLWAACAHDWLCDESNAGRYERALADGWFEAILDHTGVGARERSLMALAVNVYRWFCRYVAWRSGLSGRTGR